jgi:hypothetical protein
MHTLYSLSDSQVTKIQIAPAVAKHPHGVHIVNIYLRVTAGTDSTRLAPGRFTAIDEYIKHTAARSVIAPILTGHLNGLRQIINMGNPDD